MHTRNIERNAEVLENVKRKCTEVTQTGFTKETTAFDIGYWQAHKDMQTRIKLWEQRR